MENMPVNAEESIRVTYCIPSGVVKRFKEQAQVYGLREGMFVGACMEAFIEGKVELVRNRLISLGLEVIAPSGSASIKEEAPSKPRGRPSITPEERLEKEKEEFRRKERERLNTPRVLRSIRIWESLSQEEREEIEATGDFDWDLRYDESTRTYTPPKTFLLPS
jgi:hypothetical protein